MNYLEISVITNTLGSDLVADILQEKGSQVAIYDKQDFLDLINNKDNYLVWDYYDESLINKEDDIVLCKAYFELDKSDILKEIEKELRLLKKRSEFYLGPLELKSQIIKDCNWFDNWKKYYKPININDFVIKPLWYDIKEKNKTIIEINPGMAFGTGDHQSTQLMLSLLSDTDLKDKLILDMGTGSGILGIATLKKGAKKCYMFDIDADAIKNCKENAKINNVEDKSIIDIKSDLSDLNIQFDIIMANITADILINFKNEFIKLLKENGFLFLSGIIKEREKDVINAYNETSFKIENKKGDKTWTALKLRKI